MHGSIRLGAPDRGFACHMLLLKSGNGKTLREEPADINSCSNLCFIVEVIPIPNFRLLSLIVFVLWNFENSSLSDCDLICDYPVTAFWCL